MVTTGALRAGAAGQRTAGVTGLRDHCCSRHPGPGSGQSECAGQRGGGVPRLPLRISAAAPLSRAAWSPA